MNNNMLLELIFFFLFFKTGLILRVKLSLLSSSLYIYIITKFKLNLIKFEIFILLNAQKLALIVFLLQLSFNVFNIINFYISYMNTASIWTLNHNLNYPLFYNTIDNTENLLSNNLETQYDLKKDCFHYRNDSDNENNPNQDIIDRRSNNRLRRNRIEDLDLRIIRDRILRFVQQLAPVAQDEPFGFNQPDLHSHPYYADILQASLMQEEIRPVPLYSFSIDNETIFNFNNRLFDLNRIGGEHILNNTPFGTALLNEYVNCLRVDNLPIDGSPLHLEVYLTQAYRNLNNSVYLPDRLPVREEIYWSLYGTLRLDYLLTHPQNR